MEYGVLESKFKAIAENDPVFGICPHTFKYDKNRDFKMCFDKIVAKI